MLYLRNISAVWETNTDIDEDPSNAGIIRCVEQFPALCEPNNKYCNDIDVVLVKVPDGQNRKLAGAKVYWDKHVWRLQRVEYKNNKNHTVYKLFLRKIKKRKK